MADNIYDEIEIEVFAHPAQRQQSCISNPRGASQDMTFDSTLQIYHYPCPCGDRFEINIDDLRDGEEIAVCPSCSLQIRVIFEADDLPKPEGGSQAQAQAPQQVVVATG